MSSNPQIFISHSSQDVATVEPLARLLQTALGLSAGDIRCTSVDGYRLPGGTDTNARLRAEVNEAVLLLGVISAASVRSLYVVFELGARWGTAKPFVPLFAPGAQVNLLGGPLAGISALRLDSPQQVEQLLSEIAGHVNRTLEPRSRYSAELEIFSETTRRLQEESVDVALRSSRPYQAHERFEREVQVEVDRITIAAGLVTNYLATDLDRGLCRLENCLVLVCAKEISAMRDLIAVLEAIARAQQPLLLVARGVTGEALATLILNSQRGTLSVCVVSTATSANPKAIEQSVARACRTIIFHDEAWRFLHTAEVGDLGHARAVEATAESTTIFTAPRPPN